MKSRIRLYQMEGLSLDRPGHESEYFRCHRPNTMDMGGRLDRGRGSIPDCMPQGIVIFQAGLMLRTHSPAEDEQATSRCQDILGAEEGRRSGST